MITSCFTPQTERDQFHEVVLDGEILVYITTAIVAEEENRTFRETCLATDVVKSFMRPIMLHGAMLAETDFPAPIQISVASSQTDTLFQNGGQ